jgi:hypothetical protein
MKSRKPVKPRTKGLGNKSLTVGMVAVGAFMYVLEHSNVVLWCDASLEYTYCASLVELPLNYGEGLGMMHDLSMMDSVLR